MAATRKIPPLLQQLRKELPRLLREDPQFRGEIIALLGEYLTTREETAAILSELREMRANFERRMEEQGRRIEELSRRIEEHSRHIEDQNRRLGSVERMIGAIGARWGMMSEEAFRAGVRALFAEQADVRVESWRWQDEAGRVFGHPAEIELDAVIRDGMHVLVEIESSVSAADVLVFSRKGELYSEVTGQRPQRRLIISPFVDARAQKSAQRLGIEVHAASAPPPI